MTTNILNPHGCRFKPLIVMAGLLVGALLSTPAAAREELRLTFTTTAPGGEYKPKNILAVWAEDADGNFIKTLARWAKKRAYNLVEWEKADGESIDGITGATLKKHGTHTIRWSVRDRRGRQLPDGKYTIRLELTDHEKKKQKFHRTALGFEKNGEPFNRDLGSSDGFENIRLEYLVSPNTAPKISNSRVRDLSEKSAILRGRVDDSGGEDPAVTIFWGTRDGGTDPEKWEHRLELGIRGEMPFTAELEKLTTDTVYHFRAHAKNSIGEVWANASEKFTPCIPAMVFKKGALWRYFEGKEHPGESWATPEHDDGGWQEGPSGFGYADDDDATVLKGMKGSYLTVYLRRRFTVDDPAAVQAMTFRVDYDDGFVAYLNGEEVARRHVPEEQTHETRASTNREAGKYEEFDLDDAIPALTRGENIFAIEVHNKSPRSSDLSMIPELILAGGIRNQAGRF